jgi:hypothetical protein
LQQLPKFGGYSRQLHLEKLEKLQNLSHNQGFALNFARLEERKAPALCYLHQTCFSGTQQTQLQHPSLPTTSRAPAHSGAFTSKLRFQRTVKQDVQSHQHAQLQHSLKRPAAVLEPTSAAEADVCPQIRAKDYLPPIKGAKHCQRPPHRKLFGSRQDSSSQQRADPQGARGEERRAHLHHKLAADVKHTQLFSTLVVLSAATACVNALAEAGEFAWESLNRLLFVRVTCITRYVSSRFAVAPNALHGAASIEQPVSCYCCCFPLILL